MFVLRLSGIKKIVNIFKKIPINIKKKYDHLKEPLVIFTFFKNSFEMRFAIK